MKLEYIEFVEALFVRSSFVNQKGKINQSKEGEMMMKTLTYIFTGLFLVGVGGTAQATGCDTGENFYIEGPPCNRDFKHGPIVPTIVVDKEHPYIEGMGFALRPKEIKTIVPKNLNARRDWCCEGFTDEELVRYANK